MPPTGAALPSWSILPHPEFDTTGAGDAFAGGLAWALLEGRPALEAAGMAVAASSCAIEHYGSQESYPTPDQLVARADRLSVTPA